MRRTHSTVALWLAALVPASVFCGTVTSISTDPAADSANPASLVEIIVPSHGAQLLGALYTPAGPGPHPAAIIFHGFPGYEQNLDLAQALRRAGYDVLAVHYRGSWGVTGSFSYTHAIEDADAEVEWISSAQVSAKYHIDPARIVVIGHSMGGYMALSSAARHPEVMAAVSISGASIGHRFAGRKLRSVKKRWLSTLAGSIPWICCRWPVHPLKCSGGRSSTTATNGIS
jgi:dipeptidyl aminopeptidase/acylaminoacyl peptidase